MNVFQSAFNAKYLTLIAKEAKAKFFQEKIGGKVPEQLFSNNDQKELNSMRLQIKNPKNLDFNA